jgi:carboxyl-terminal processing protease
VGDEQSAPSSESAPDQQLTQRTQRTRRAQGRGRLGGRLGTLLVSVLALALVFSLGNLASYLGFVQIGSVLHLQSTLTQGEDTPEKPVASSVLAARLTEVANAVDRHALATLTQQTLDDETTALLRSYLEALGDPYAQYYTAEEYAAYKRTSSGAFSGIGVLLAVIDEKVTVLDVYDGSPAQDEGVQAGDVLVAIDGVRKQWEINEATHSIQRAEGEQVTIIWLRDGVERSTTLTLRSVNIPNLIVEQIGEVGYIYLARFNAQSEAELRSAISSLDSDGVEGFILDLRDNPGGLLNQAIGITSLFVEQGAVVKIEGRQSTDTRRVNGDFLTSKPLVVLVNGSSASASELVAAALQDHGRALVVGEVTYGKGTVQETTELSFGGAVKYTIAHYLSPNGTRIDGVGVTPDIIVAPLTAEEAAKEPESATDSDSPAPTQTPPAADGAAGTGTDAAGGADSKPFYVAGRDAQLDAALKALRAQLPSA